jgi:thiosulfate dehydrogenase [quinone] large subunit
LQRFSSIQTRNVESIPLSPLSKLLFANTRIAWLWFILRLYVSYQWLTSGIAKLTGRSIAFGSFGQASPGGAWVFTAHGNAGLKGFIGSALTHANGPFPSVQGWYAAFLEHVVLPNTVAFSYVITFGEVLVGLGLLLGAFTGIAAFFGIVMNMNYLFAGSISINPILCICSLLLVLAWRVSGFWGIDRYLLPLLGTPWTGSFATPSRAKSLTMTVERLS